MAEEGEDDSGNRGMPPIDFLSLAGLCGNYGLSLVWEEIGSVCVERYYSRREKQIKSTNYSIG